MTLCTNGKETIHTNMLHSLSTTAAILGLLTTLYHHTGFHPVYKIWIRVDITSLGRQNLVSQKNLMFRRAKKHGGFNTIMNGTACYLPCHSGSIFSDRNLQFGQDKI